MSLLWGKLFIGRLKAQWETERVYLLRVFSNSGIFIAFGLLMYVYVKLFKWFDQLVMDRFEFILFFSIIMAVFLTRNSLTTLLRETDIYFMLPAESELTPYFKYAFYFSLFIQALKVIVLMLILYPLFQSKTDNHILFLTTCIVLLCLKYLNMNAVFYANKEIYLPIQFTVNWILLNLFFYHLLLFLLIVGIISYVVITRQTYILSSDMWLMQINKEQKRKSFYYTFLNLFIDIPSVQHRVRERKYLFFLIKRSSFIFRNPFLYLLIRSSLRYGEFFGVYIRLSFVMLIALLISTYPILTVCITMLGLFLTTLQVLHNFKPHIYPLMLRTYPITNRDVKLGLEYIVFSLLVLQILSLLLLLISCSIKIQNILLLQVLSLAVAYILSFWYVPKKTKDIFND
ncbi:MULTISPECIES: ABC transporter permease [Bacillus]|uniref:ABC transporter permease n=1 Tax=Bacillus TaxID=1386 RepID=UPI002452E60B|nr:MULTISPECIES: ABC transporter permease [Bacillus]MDH3081264.1 ABC transporter permease [Bacillus amyloliquefaciens]MDU0074641.1 ABC transporter permease [Bacillus sp. IG2]MDU0100351.1 ABC transporter permease [Bacillus sp. IS1]MEC2272986.1 ABC transporter permease [Bacillus velezensis]MED3677455.1 ABC transporter permease [Bacillus velezensis]